MFSTLRARLWLSYAALIITALGVAGFVLILFLLRNPFLYRQALARTSAAEGVIVTQMTQAAPTHSTISLDEIAHAFDVRALVFSSNGSLIQDTNPSATTISFPARSVIPLAATSTRDLSGRVWLYDLHQLPNGNWLMVAVPRPKVAVLSILTDDLLPPLLEGGLIALLLSLVLAFAIARWVADPLQRLIAATHTIPTESVQPVATGGPHEVQELARAFNAMVARVQSSQKSQRDFVANVSHELKTPLTSIQGFAQAIIDGTAGTPEDHKQAAEVIFNEASRMHRMVLNLLDLARMDTGLVELQMAPVDVNALLNGVVEKFTPIASKANVEVRARFAKDLPVLNGDGDRLSQVFTNLLDNALKFTPQGGSITLRAVRDRGEIQIAVDDTGKGIPPQSIPHIFDRFYQADVSRQGGDQHGAGLGLAIVKEIVSAHGGRISVRSMPGRGTAFIVHLPLNQSTTNRPAGRA